MPQRCCLKITGPRELNFTANAIMHISGDITTIANVAIATSNILFAFDRATLYISVLTCQPLRKNAWERRHPCLQLSTHRKPAAETPVFMRG